LYALEVVAEEAERLVASRAQEAPNLAGGVIMVDMVAILARN
jgi:hypothetical protein